MNKQLEKAAAAIAPHILLAEDDKEMRALLARALRRADYEVVECCDGVELLEHLGSYVLHEKKHERIDLVISDIRMPGITGLEILEGARKSENFPPFVLITAFGDAATHAKAEQFGALAVFDKPFDIDDLVAKVRKILTSKRSKLETTGAPMAETSITASPLAPPTNIKQQAAKQIELDRDKPASDQPDKEQP